MRRVSHWVGGVVLCAILVGGMGGDCDGFSFFLTVVPAGSNGDSTVTVELVNLASYPVDPFLFVSPYTDITSNAELINEDNLIVLEGDPLVQPGETVTLTFNCEDIGTVTTDHAMLILSDQEQVASENGPWVVGGAFGCGDMISFLFVDDATVGFHTRVEINHVFLED